MFLFNPLTDQQLEESNLLCEGKYNFQVIKSKSKLSKAGNQMAELIIAVEKNLIFDYLIFSEVNLNIRKISHFCKSVGIYDDYKKGQLPENLEGLTGIVEIGIKDSVSNGNGGFYPKKNIVIDYLIDESTNSDRINGMKPLPAVEDKFNDDIPF